jgi:hypothetical protein
LFGEHPHELQAAIGPSGVSSHARSAISRTKLDRTRKKVIMPRKCD